MKTTTAYTKHEFDEKEFTTLLPASEKREAVDFIKAVEHAAESVFSDDDDCTIFDGEVPIAVVCADGGFEFSRERFTVEQDEELGRIFIRPIYVKIPERIIGKFGSWTAASPRDEEGNPLGIRSMMRAWTAAGVPITTQVRLAESIIAESIRNEVSQPV